MKKILSLVLLTVSCLIQAQDRTKKFAATTSAAQATITTNLATSNPEYLYSQYPVALDLHDCVLKRHTEFAVDEFWRDKETSWRDLGCFAWHAACYLTEKYILRRETVNIERYVQTDIAKYASLTPTEILNSNDYSARAIRAVSCFAPMENSAQFLQKIKDQGHPVIAFSNIGPKSYTLLAQKYPELMHKFAGKVIIENSTTPAKPEPAAYQRCLSIIADTTKVAPEQVVFLDDSPKKLAAAKKFRATKITIDRDGKSIIEPESESRFIPILCESGSPAQILASRAKVLAKLAELRQKMPTAIQ